MADAEMGNQMDETEQKPDPAAEESVTGARLTCVFFHFPLPPCAPRPPLSSAVGVRREMSDVKGCLCCFRTILCFQFVNYTGSARKGARRPFLDMVY